MDKKDIKKAFGANLKKYRLINDKSQEEIALAEGMSATFVSELERGIRCPTIDTVFKLSKILNVTPAQLINFDSDFYTNTEAHIIVLNVLENVPDDSKLKLARIFERLAELYITEERN
jgi:transcriptional regulator with XRE-family HTH domain